MYKEYITIDYRKRIIEMCNLLGIKPAKITWDHNYETRHKELFFYMLYDQFGEEIEFPKNKVTSFSYWVTDDDWDLEEDYLMFHWWFFSVYLDYSSADLDILYAALPHMDFLDFQPWEFDDEYFVD